jgi:hypothetical protein
MARKGFFMWYCPRCGKALTERDRFCTNCGVAMATPANPTGFTSGYMPSNARPGGNGLAVAGFVLALIALFFGWIPFYGWAVWLNALIFSCIGLSKARKTGDRMGLAIAGLVISLVALLTGLLVLVGIISYVSTDIFDYYYY